MVSLTALGKNPSLSLLTSGVCPQSLAFSGVQVPQSSAVTVFSLCVSISSSLRACPSLCPNFIRMPAMLG